MARSKRKRINDTEHPNYRFRQFIDDLSPRFAKIFMQQVQLQCLGRMGTDNKEHWRYHNWKQMKAMVPLEYRFTINRIANRVYIDYLDSLFAKEEDEKIIPINLFNDQILENMRKLTSIRVERVRKKISQTDLGKTVGCAAQTIGKIENGKFPGVRLDLAVKIANYFELKIEDFEEFQSIIDQ